MSALRWVRDGVAASTWWFRVVVVVIIGSTARQMFDVGGFLPAVLIVVSECVPFAVVLAYDGQSRRGAL